MIPYPVENECVPPLRAERGEVIQRFARSPLDVVVCGPSPLARELVRLAAHNSISVGYLCRHDFVESHRAPLCRRIISEILSARYDGALDLNHVEILAIEHESSHAVKIACRCRISGKAFEITTGAVINETGAALGRITASPRNILRPWRHRLLQEQSGVMRFIAGRLQSKSIARHAEFILQELLRQASNRTGVVPLHDLPLIDSEFLSGESGKKSAYAIERLNSFVAECDAHGLPPSVARRAIDRFGTRVSHILLLPQWFEQVDPEFLRGELHLAIATELPRSITEFFQGRLGIGSSEPHGTLRRIATSAENTRSAPEIAEQSEVPPNLRPEHDLAELTALFEQLQHFDSL